MAYKQAALNTIAYLMKVRRVELYLNRHHDADTFLSSLVIVSDRSDMDNLCTHRDFHLISTPAGL